jgi:lipopolysaccharide/colanic/teichoic acid biosynthesis glycosyltransferase
MSVVGPRPSPFEENQLCPAWREARLSVRPGITGLWQVSRSRQRGAADFQEWIYYDTQYVERRSFLLDLRIILLTIKEMSGHGQ